MGIEIDPKFYLASNCLVKDNESKLYLVFVSEHVSGKPLPLEDTEEVKWFNVIDLSPEMLTPKTYENIIRASDRNRLLNQKCKMDN